MKYGFLLLLLMVGCSKPRPKPKDAVEGRAMHYIQMANAVDGVECSAEAVGRNTLLTAAHCLVGTDIITVDGDDKIIDYAFYDHNDHVLLVLEDANFKSFLQMDQRAPKKDEHVRLWANPGDSRNVYREGYLEKSKSISGMDDVNRTLYKFILPTFSGDSGGGLITDEGKIISLVTLGDTNAQAGVFVLDFSPVQLAHIQ